MRFAAWNRNIYVCSLFAKGRSRWASDVMVIARRSIARVRHGCGELSVAMWTVPLVVELRVIIITIGIVR